jgi:predicted nucleic acid-binding Zn ribbon protein
MDKHKTQRVGDLLPEVLKANKLDQKLNETRLLSAWEEVLGEGIANYTESKYIKNKVLYVKLKSAVLRNELLLSREQIIRSLNDMIGADVIVDIRLY